MLLNLPTWWVSGEQWRGRPQGVWYHSREWLIHEKADFVSETNTVTLFCWFSFFFFSSAFKICICCGFQWRLYLIQMHIIFWSLHWLLFRWILHFCVFFKRAHTRARIWGEIHKTGGVVALSLYWTWILFTRLESKWEETEIKMRKQFYHLTCLFEQNIKKRFISLLFYGWS